MINFFKKLIWYLSSTISQFRGEERIVDFISRPRKPPFLSLNRDGITWKLTGHDLNEFYVAIRPNHSPSLFKAMAKEIERTNGSVLWDVGANIGAVSLPLAKHFKKLNAILFEPSAEVAGRLIRNLAANPDLHARIKIMNFSLSNSDCIVNLYTSNADQNSGMAGLEPSRDRSQFSVTIQSYKGDSLINLEKLPPPDLIKVDVEGFEIEVLYGLKSTLIKHRPIIIFEHSIYRLEERNRPRNEVLNFLESIDYDIFNLENNKKVTLLDLENSADFIAKPA